MARATLTVADIIAGTERDVQKQLFAAGQATLLTDYCDRTHLELCRLRNWEFLKSTPQRFMTLKEQSLYWIGASGSAGAGQVDTNLNLSDIDYIDERSVRDASNYNNLGNVLLPWNQAADARRDSSPSPDRPRYWAYTEDLPNVLQLYPCPTESSGYQALPAAPYCTVTAGGSLPARYYSVMVTLTDSAGNESSASDETTIFIPANSLLRVHSPSMPVTTLSSGVTLNQYKVYAAGTTVVAGVITPASSNQEQFQTGSTTNLGSTWTEPTSGLVTGTAPFPTTNALEEFRGYVIQFQYFKRITRLTATNSALQLPDDYRDVITAGVNALAFAYLSNSNAPHNAPLAALWDAKYNMKKQALIRGEINRRYPPTSLAPDPQRNLYYNWPNRDSDDRFVD